MPELNHVRARVERTYCMCYESATTTYITDYSVVCVHFSGHRSTLHRLILHSFNIAMPVHCISPFRENQLTPILQYWLSVLYADRKNNHGFSACCLLHSPNITNSIVINSKRLEHVLNRPEPRSHVLKGLAALFARDLRRGLWGRRGCRAHLRDVHQHGQGDVGFAGCRF